MISPRFCAAAVVAASLSFGLVGCGSGGSSSPSPAPSASVDAPLTTRSTYGPLEFTLTTPKTVYKQGEAITMVFSVKNITASTVEILQNGGLTYTKVTENGTTVYEAHPNIATFSTLDIAPGQVITEQNGWAQYKGQAPIPPGKYQVKVRLDSNLIAVLGENYSKQELTKQETNELLGSPPIEVTVE